MKIMKVVYSAELYEEYNYMGEQSWAVGEKFNGEFVMGVVTDIYLHQPSGAVIHVNGECAMFIPIHAVQRIYYGENKIKTL